MQGTSIVALVVTLLVAAVARYWLTAAPRSKSPLNRPPFDTLYPVPGRETEDVEIDIIAVHGLGSNVDWSWTWKDPTGSRHVHWLRDPDMLPAVVPKARIAVYGYDSKWHSKAPQTRLQLCGEDLARTLHTFRKGDRARPILFIGHSLGGLVIQNALIHAELTEELRYMLRLTVGFVTIGSPFRGTKMQRLAKLGAFCTSFLDSNSGIIRDLAYDSDALRDKRHEFSLIRDRYSIPACAFFELYKTDYGKKFGLPGIFRGTVVPEDSACVDGWDRASLQADHIGMNKFSGPQDRSFIDVSERIRTMCQGTRRLIQSRQSSATIGHFIVPFGRNECFVGREAILQQLLRRVLPSAIKDTCQRTALDGLGGIGKTQIAVELAFRVRDTAPECSIFWVPAMTAATFESAYRKIASRLQITATEQFDVNAKELVKDALSDEKAGEWLMIIDNADDVDLFFSQELRLSSYLPSSRKGSIVFTTRRHDLAVRCSIPAAHIISVPAMEVTEAKALFASGLNETQASESEPIERVVKLLEYLPLAVKQASAYLAMNGVPVSTYLKYCQSSESSFMKMLSQNFEDTTRYENICNPVAMTWNISFNRISQDKPLAAQLLKMMCILAERDIPIDLLSRGQEEIETLEAIGLLEGYAFVTKQHDLKLLGLHRLVRLAMQNWLKEGEGLPQAYEDAALQLVAWLKGVKDGMSVTLATGALQHVHALLTGPECFEEYLLSDILIYSSGCWGVIGQSHVEWEYWNKGLELNGTTEMLSLRRTLHQDDDTEPNAFSQSVIQQEERAVCDPRAPKDTQSLSQKISHQVVILFERNFSAVSNQLIAIVLKSGTGYNFGAEHGSRDCKRFLQHANETLQEWSTEWGPEHHIVFEMKRLFGDHLSVMGEYDAAEALLYELWIAETKVLGPAHADTIKTAESLASVLFLQREYQEAERIHFQVLKTLRSTPRTPQLRILFNLKSLAGAMLAQQKHEEALAVLEEILSIYNGSQPNGTPEMYECMSSLAGSLNVLQRFEKAEELLRRALMGQEQASKPDQWEISHSSLRLAWALEGQQKFEEAEKFYRKCLRSTMKLDKEKKLHVRLHCLGGLSYMLSGQEKAQAEHALRSNWFLQRESVGSEDPMTLWAAYKLGSELERQGKYQKAVKMVRHAYSLNKKILGPSDPRTLLFSSSLALIYDKQGEFRKAEQAYRELSWVVGQGKNAEDPEARMYLRSASRMLHQQGKKLEAWDLYCRNSNEPELSPKARKFFWAILLLFFFIIYGGMFEMAAKKDPFDFSKSFFAIEDVEGQRFLFGIMIAAVVQLPLIHIARLIWLKQRAKSDTKKIRVSESHLQDC